MCGLFGAIRPRGSFSVEELARFQKARDKVSYRGPDAVGEKTFALKEGSIYLGHRRLSIIDLSEEGVQPMTNDGNVWIIFNGEIFNYVEWREELRRLGQEFKTNTDTEVILNAYKAWGEAGFARMNGMWAFVLVDVPGKKIVLSRDRFSIKPLYFTWEKGTLLFASEIKQLPPFPHKRDVNEQVLLSYLKQALIDSSHPETFFQGIWQLKPRHSLVIDLSTGKTEERPYWDFGQEDIPLKEQEALARMRELFLDSVRILAAIKQDTDITVLWSGQGGDEILGGYRKFFIFYLKELLLQGKLVKTAQEVFGSLVHHTVLWQLSLAEAKRYIPYYRGWRDPVSRVLRKDLQLKPLWQSESLAQRQKADVERYTVPALTHYEDRNAMKHSMEGRLPFLDYSLVGFALRMPNSLRIRNGWMKFALRKTMHELPREIAWRRDKQGFLNPEAKWLKEDLKEHIFKAFQNSRLAKRGLVDQQALLGLYRAFLGGSRQVMETDISRFLLAELWLRKFDL